MRRTLAAPGLGDLPVSARSAALGDPIAPGNPLVHAVYVRDAYAALCPAPTGSTFHPTNAYQLTW